jgi:hypothetical protein
MLIVKSLFVARCFKEKKGKKCYCLASSFVCSSFAVDKIKYTIIFFPKSFCSFFLKKKFFVKEIFSSFFFPQIFCQPFCS